MEKKEKKIVYKKKNYQSVGEERKHKIMIMITITREGGWLLIVFSLIV
jgi:hypothetical protein